MRTSRRLFFVTAAAAAALAARPCPAAQQPPSAPEDARTAIARVAAEAGCVILLDGPVSLRVGAAAGASGEGKDAAARVAALAEALDCDAREAGRGVFVLARRYARDADALPGVTPAECAAALADVEAALKPFLPSAAGDHATHSARLVRSLTAAQLQAMAEAGEQGIPAAALTPAQRRALADLVSSFHLGNGSRLLRLVRTRLEELASPEAELTSQLIGGRKVYGVSFPSGGGNRFLFLPLTAPNFALLDAQGLFRTGDLRPWAKSPEGAGAATASPRTEPPPPAFPTLVGALGPSARIDAALAEKPLEAFGAAAGLSPAVLAQAAGRLYDLRVSRRDGDGSAVARRARLRPAGLGGLPEAVLRAVPAPLRRFFGAELGAEQNGRPKFAQEAAHALRRRAARVVARHATARDAGGRLASQPVPLSEFPPEVRSAVANFVIAEAAPELERYVTDPASYVVRPDAAFVHATVSEVGGKKGYSLTLRPAPGEAGAAFGITAPLPER